MATFRTLQVTSIKTRKGGSVVLTLVGGFELIITRYDARKNCGGYSTAQISPAKGAQKGPVSSEDEDHELDHTEIPSKPDGEGPARRNSITF